MMDNKPAQHSASLLIADYLRRVDAGEHVNPQEIIEAHPEHADELQRYFENEAAFGDLTRGGDATGETANKSQSSANSRSSGGRKKRDTVREADANDSLPFTGNFLSELPAEFGRYRILKRLGQGAMGAVFLAHDTSLGRDVALKTPMLGSSPGDAGMIERFEREAKAAATLHHRNICPVFDVGEIKGIRYLTMAYIEGKPLSSYVSEDKPLSAKQAAVVVRKLALALHEAHALGVVHRDLKPDNVMIDKTGEPVIMDFGLASKVENRNSTRLTQVGTLMGSPGYMSPEQVSGDPEAVGPKSDMYSLGVILFELLTGKLPFEGSLTSVLTQILTTEPPQLSELLPEIDPRLEALCSKLLAKKPDDRYPALQDVAADLTDVLRKRPRRDRVRSTVADPNAQPVEEADVFEQLARAERGESINASSRRRTLAESPGQPLSTHSGNAFASIPVWMRWTAAAVAGAVIMLGIILMLRTPYGTLRVEISDPDLQVQVDGQTLTIQDGDEPIPLKAGMHRLAVMIGKTLLPLDGETVISLDGEERRVRLSVGGVELTGNEFRITADGETAMTVRMVEAELPTPDDNGGLAGSDRAAEPENKWVSLFNGKDLTGWKELGNANAVWRVRDGVLFGSWRKGSVTGGSHLQTKRDDYQNFRFRVQMTVCENWASSLVFLWRTYFGRNSWYRAMIGTDKGRDVWETGILRKSLKGEPLAAPVPRLRFRADQWLTMEVRVEGKRIRIYVDDKLCSEHELNELPKPGSLGIALSGAANIRIKKIEVQELPPPNRSPITSSATSGTNAASESESKSGANWTSLLDASLGQWTERYTTGGWKFEDGVVQAIGPERGWLATDKEYADFELELEFNLQDSGNSGIFLRIPAEGNPWGSDFPEIQILHDTASRYRSLSLNQKTGSLYGIVAAAPQVSVVAHQWYAMKIRVCGPQLTVAVNGVNILNTNLDDYPAVGDRKPAFRRRSGHIGLQKQKFGVKYRNIRIREITPSC